MSKQTLGNNTTRVNLVDPSELHRNHLVSEYRVPKEDLHQGTGKGMFWDYKPTEEALAINQQRISDRMPK